MSQLPDESILLQLLERKPTPEWRIYSKETTPECVQGEPVDDVGRLRALCDINRQLLLDSGVTQKEVEEIRRSNPDPNYWHSEAEFLRDEFWRIQTSRQLKIKKQGKKGPTKLEVVLGDGPISSRLRQRACRASAVIKHCTGTSRRKKSSRLLDKGS